MDKDLKDDLLLGAKAIAEYIGCNQRTVYSMLSNRHLPGFKIGETIAVRKSSILKRIEELEKQAQE